MNRRKAIKLLLLGSASATALISTSWLDKIKSMDLSYLFEQKPLIAELAEIIIPATDTPGAKAVQVEEFIIRMLADCTDFRSLSNFIVGLQELQEYSLVTFKKTFILCDTLQKEAVLREFERRAYPFKGILGKVEKKIFGQPFFTTLRNYTVIGFCTSQVGATQVLNYESVPGRYENVAPVSSSQRSWATK